MKGYRPRKDIKYPMLGFQKQTHDFKRQNLTKKLLSIES
jgi:hypothetical protein